MQFLGTSLLTAYLFSSRAPCTVPEGLRVADDQAPGYTVFKLRFGDDETIFLLQKEDPLLKALQKFLSYPLATKRSLVTESSFVEVKFSPTNGLGVFAAKDFVPGDLIISEHPMVSALHFP
jgi:hypothetical protein